MPLAQVTNEIETGATRHPDVACDERVLLSGGHIQRSCGIRCLGAPVTGALEDPLQHQSRRAVVVHDENTDADVVKRLVHRSGAVLLHLLHLWFDGVVMGRHKDHQPGTAAWCTVDLEVPVLALCNGM